VVFLHNTKVASMVLPAVGKILPEATLVKTKDAKKKTRYIVEKTKGDSVLLDQLQDWVDYRMLYDPDSHGSYVSLVEEIFTSEKGKSHTFKTSQIIKGWMVKGTDSGANIFRESFDVATAKSSKSWDFYLSYIAGRDWFLAKYGDVLSTVFSKVDSIIGNGKVKYSTPWEFGNTETVEVPGLFSLSLSQEEESDNLVTVEIYLAIDKTMVYNQPLSTYIAVQLKNQYGLETTG